MPQPILTRAAWPFSLPADTGAAELAELAATARRLASGAQYGWGHTVDLGPLRIDGLLGEDYLEIAGGLDEWGWWPTRLDGLTVADVGCFSGALALMMADRGADVVHAVDEIPEHLAQCSFLCRALHVHQVRPVLASAYRCTPPIAASSLDLVLLAGVLYHLSDMLVGLYAMRELLRPGGLLLIQSHGVEDFERSYANFGRFTAGRWWQPTALCILDMLEFMGFTDCEVRFYRAYDCLVRARRGTGEIPFRRGLNWSFANLQDARARSLDMGLMAPAHPQ